MMLFGKGFLVSQAEAEVLGLGRRAGLEKHIRTYRNGRDLMARPRGAMAIDLYGLRPDEVRDHYPEVYQHLLRTVKTERDRNRDADIKARWWLFGRTRDEIRPALAPLQRYIATVETAKHRVFQFLDASILPDNKILAIALSDAHTLGVLSSRIHEAWYLASAGKRGVYERDAVYVKSRCFDPFPFPEADEHRREAIRRPAEALDALRKQVLAEHPDLTLTKLYNVREALHAGHTLTPAEADIRDRGLVMILDEHHEAIDAAVAGAYGWPADLGEEEVLARLAALNRQRAQEEARGIVRWLRPDYQRPRFGTPGKAGEQIEAALPTPISTAAGKPVFPAEAVGRVAAVLAALAGASAPVDAGTIAARFRQGRKVEREIRDILISLARVGEISAIDGGHSFARRLTGTG